MNNNPCCDVRERLSSLVSYTVRILTSYKMEWDEVIDKLASLTDVELHGNPALADVASRHLQRICDNICTDVDGNPRVSGQSVHPHRLLNDMLMDLVLLLAPAE
jgi:hypothetical protein